MAGGGRRAELRSPWAVQKAQAGWTLSRHILTILAPPSLAWIPVIMGLLLHISRTLSEPGMTLFTPKYEKNLSQAGLKESKNKQKSKWRFLVQVTSKVILYYVRLNFELK